ncbi:Eukaryotic porin/Tom40 [Corchorus capsularis]|uniref:Eukaryotic porin/Tom40 n=1 Tax=Corchorus capsularis TaxID=210143 RepID=A0A1R3J7K6_COCAP|nr:Eukaryotic porin/Tom40 [Corchorus capsularis]
MNPGLYFAIGKNARDLLYKDYAQQKQPFQLGYHSLDWSLDLSCQIEEILPRLNSVFRVVIPDSGKAEVQYLRDYLGFSASVGLRANPATATATGLDPIANISGVIGTSLISLGADLGFNITTRTLQDLSAGLSFSTTFLIASMTWSDNFDTVKASFYHALNAPTRTALAAELKHRFSMDSTSTLTIGAQHALFPCTMIKARLNTDGKVSALLRHQVLNKFHVSIAGETDFKDSINTPRIGLSLALNP